MPHSAFTERAALSEGLGRRGEHGVRPDADVTTRVPPGIDIHGPLNTDDTVAIALWNDAPFQESLAKLGLSRAELAQAGLLSNPTLAVLFPLGPKQLEFAATFPLEALWLRPRRVRIAALDAERAANELLQTGLDLIRDVRVAVSDVALARDRIRTSTEAVQVRDRVTELTTARERAGESSALDVATQTAEAARARDEAARLRWDVALAEQQLLYLLGLTGVAEHLDVAPIPTPTSDPPPEWLEQRALAARPDIRAAEIAVEAAGERAGLAVAEIFAISGIADANGSGKQGFEMGPGAQLLLPLFNQNQAARLRADAEVQRAAWGYVGARQRVLREVRSSSVRCRQAIEAWHRWSTELVPFLEELVRGSEAAYEIGELSPLMVQENVRQLVAARAREAELAADVRRAWADMERSVGARIPEDGAGHARR
ncbi:MAG: TolC family protein [bacterium]|nr:TolC family protein [bacterium]